MFKTAAQYSKTQIILHWLIAAGVVFEIVMNDMVRSAYRAQRSSDYALTPLDFAFWSNPHVIVGTLILLLTLWRILLRLTHGAPAEPDAEPAPFQILAKLAHLAFYVLLIAIPVSGLLQYATGNQLAHELHEFAEPAFISMIALHIGAVLVHQFVWKTNILGRMLWRR